MQVTHSGLVFDTRTAPANERSASFNHVMQTTGGTLLATMRLGSDREGPDGHTAIFASDDRGETWQRRYLELADTDWDGIHGETRGWMLTELEPGELTASVLYVDRLDGEAAWVHPRTQGLLPMHTYQLISHDGGRTWPDRRRIDLSPWPGASPTGPVLRLADGTLAQPFEHWKEYEDDGPAHPAALLRLSHDDGATWDEDVMVARHPRAGRYFWDQRIAMHPLSGDHVAMFWTHDPAAGRDTDVHIGWAGPDGRAWSEPVSTGLPGQHCQPIALGGDRLLAVYTHRGHPAGIRACLSYDFGRTWDRSSELQVWRAAAMDAPAQVSVDAAALPDSSQAETWSAMGAQSFGHPIGVRLDDDEVFVTFYGGSGETRPARWARIAVGPA